MCRGTIPKWEYSVAITASLICRQHISGILRGVVGSQSGNDISCQMTPLKPLQVQQQAIQARLNYFLGADEYDRLFAGFEILHIKNKVLTLSVRPACTNEDRKSTRLNSSHQIISYAVFCLKKKKQQLNHM